MISLILWTDTPMCSASFTCVSPRGPQYSSWRISPGWVGTLSAGIISNPFKSALLIKVLDSDAVPRLEAAPCGFDAVQEPRVMLEPVFEPVVFGLKPDQDARRLAMPGNDDVLLLGL